jgi:hypothetical protein
MTKITRFMLLLLFAASCIARAQNGTGQPRGATFDTGLVPLTPPFTISTAPHFAVLVQFPRADSIRRIALGDSNYFLAEADKDDPHYAIIKQTRTTTSKSAPPIETNMLVYMASGRVVNILLKAGKLAETAYSVDYSVPSLKPPQPANDPPPVPPEKVRRETALKELSDKMLAEVKGEPKEDAGISAGGLIIRTYRTERLTDCASMCRLRSGAHSSPSAKPMIWRRWQCSAALIDAAAKSDPQGLVLFENLPDQAPSAKGSTDQATTEQSAT